MTDKAFAFGLLASLAALGVLTPACGGSDEGAKVTTSGGTASNGEGGEGVSGGTPATGGTSSTGGSLNLGGQSFGGAEGEDCGGVQVDAKPVEVNLLFVIDRSESMLTTPAGFDAPKWDSMVSALDTSLAAIDGELRVGLQFFPDAAAADDLCGMPSGNELDVDVGEDAATELREALDETEPAGATPAAAALDLAYRYFSEGAGQQLSGDSYVLLALDGGPNCNDALACGEDTPEDRELCTQTYDKPESCGAESPFNCCSGQPTGCLDSEDVIQQVERLRDAGVRTLVVGIPGSEQYGALLDALAVAGGQPASVDSPKYFKVDDAGALSDTLESLTRGLVRSCDIALDSEPPDDDLVNVFLDGEVVPRGSDDGWQLDSSTSPPTIRLEGDACDRLLTRGAESVTVEFGCESVTVE